MPRDVGVLTRELLERPADTIEPLAVWPDRGTYRVTVGARSYLVKADDDHPVVAREVAGHERAAAAGVPVPEVVAVAFDAFAATWVDGPSLLAHPAPAAWRAAGTAIRRAHATSGGPPFGDGFGGYDMAFGSWRELLETVTEHHLHECERDLGLPAAAAARIRAALTAARPLLDHPQVGWCHGDLQPDHVLVDATTDRVAAIIDWADHGSADVVWDFAVITLDHPSYLSAFLDGYGADAGLRIRLDQLMPLYTAIRRIGESTWLARHGFPYADNLRHAAEWRDESRG